MHHHRSGLATFSIFTQPQPQYYDSHTGLLQLQQTNATNKQINANHVEYKFSTQLNDLPDL